jgi:hypothetical protein
MAQHIGFVVYGDISVTTGGNYYDRMLICALENHGFTVTIFDPAELKPRKGRVGDGKIDVWIIDELCHPDFFSLKDFDGMGNKARRMAMVNHLAAQERLVEVLRGPEPGGRRRRPRTQSVAGAVLRR